MSQYYTPQRTKNLYNPGSKEPFKLSRTRIELFLNCPRCFYFDRKLGISRPPGFPFSLNSAVDALLKKEFDICRTKNKKHPLIQKYGVDAQPIPHKDLDKWRHNFTGVQFLHKPTNLLIFGAIDDLWAKTSPQPSPSQGEGEPEYIVVDYKATAKAEEITKLDKDWHKGYKRQMEVYQWLLRQNGYKVSDIGYFVYCNGKTDKKAFDAKLEFDITLISYKGNDNWIEKTIFDIYKCLNSNKIPKANPDCDYCNYRKAILSVEKNS